MFILVVGSVALDTVETPFEKRAETLGGAASYFATAATLSTQVNLEGLQINDPSRLSLEHAALPGQYPARIAVGGARAGLGRAPYCP